jgi:hypothetical protein
MSDIANTDRYVRALETMRRERMPPSHEALLREHWKARKHTMTWADLAAKAGYADGDAVNLQYEALAERVGRLLGLSEPPHPLDSPEPAWILVLVLVAHKKGARGHKAYILRRNVIEAMARVGMINEDEAGTRR